MPWQGGVFGGKLLFEAGGKEYEMTRVFGRRPSEDAFDLIDLDTSLPSFDYSAKIGEELFHLDKESFLRTVFTAQQDCATRATDDVNALIGDLAGRAGDMGCYEDAEKRLKEAANRLTPKRPTGTLYRRGEEIAELARRKKQEQERGPDPDKSLRVCRARREKAGQRLAALEGELFRKREEGRQAEAALKEACGNLDAALSDAPKFQAEKKNFPKARQVDASLRDQNSGCVKGTDGTGRRVTEEDLEKREDGPARFLPFLILLMGSVFLPAGIAIKLFTGYAGGTALAVIGAVLAATGAALACSGRGGQNGAGRKPLPGGAQKYRRREAPREKELRKSREPLRQEDIQKESLQEEPQAERIQDIRQEDIQKESPQEDIQGETIQDVRQEELQKERIQDIRQLHQKYRRCRRALDSKNSQTEEIRQDILSCRAQIASLDREMAELMEQMEEREEEEGRLRDLRARQEADEAAYRHVTAAADLLARAKESLTARYSDPIREGFASYWERITGYSAAGIRVDANTSVTVQELGRQRDASELSRGYGDLAGICLRAALADAMYPPGRGEKPPLILDDPFTNLDDEKIRGALRFLEEVGERYQILYLTCSQSRSGQARRNA